MLQLKSMGDDGPRDSGRGGTDEGGAPVPGNLGVLFIAAALALAFVLGIVALIGYFALSRAEPPDESNRSARRLAPVSGQL